MLLVLFGMVPAAAAVVEVEGNSHDDCDSHSDDGDIDEGHLVLARSMVTPISL